MKIMTLLQCGLAIIMILGISGSAFCTTTDWNSTQRTTSEYNKYAPRSVIDPNNSMIYYVWHEDDGSKYQIWTAQTNTDGTGFAESATKRTETLVHDFDPQLVLDSANGKIYYTWSQYEPVNRNQIWTAVLDIDSDDWEATQQTTGNFLKCSPQLVLDADSDTIYYVWTQIDEFSDVQIWTAGMNIDGTGFSESAEERTTSDFDKHEPQLVLDTDRNELQYVWYEEDGTGTFQVWTAVLDIDSNVWSETIRTTGSLNKMNPQLVLDQSTDQIYYVWTVEDGAISQIWTAEMNTDRTGWSAADKTDSDYYKLSPMPVLDPGSNTIYYAWFESDDTNYQIWTAEMNTDGTGWSETKETTSGDDKTYPQLVLDTDRNQLDCVFLQNDGTYDQIWTSSIDIVSTTWYLAEGCTTDFDTWILVQNPNSTDAAVTLTFMRGADTTVTHTDTVSANRRKTFYVNDYVTSGDVSTKVESTNGVGIIAERAMYWDDPTGEYWQGGHDSIGVTRTATTWYLAEGCTTGFDTYVLVQNPNSIDAAVTLTFMRGDDTPVTHTDTVSANRRKTFYVNDYVTSGDVSTKVESTNDVGIIAERAMYWDDPTGEYWQGGHNSAGVTRTATTWYLAEGCTTGFDTWVLVQNPNSTDAAVTLTFMRGDDTPVTHTDTVSANRRKTFKVNDYVTSGDVSTKVESTNDVGIIAERAMYWYDTEGEYWQGGHDSVGVSGTATTWYLAEGCTTGFDTWVLVQNPNSTDAAVTLTFIRGDDTPVTHSDIVSANRRKTFKVNDYVSSGDVSTKVQSTNSVGIIAERAMYWYDTTDSFWQGGHDSHGHAEY